MAKDFRSQFKATPVKKLKSKIDEDNSLFGGSSEYIQLEDGKTVKLRIFPAHPGFEDFYITKKSYWISIAKDDGDLRRATVLDSVQHGGTEMDVIQEYTKMAKKVCANDTKKINAISGDKDSLNPQISWEAYASRVIEEKPLHPMHWEFKKLVRDGLNKLSISEEDDEAIEVDPFTDPDEGIPVFVKYLKSPNKKKGENYYDVTVSKKPKALPIPDEVLEEFMKLTPLQELYNTYTMKDFDKALEGLQNFDEEHGIGLFEDDDWLEKVEEIRAQYESGEAESDDDESKKKTSKKVETKKAPVKKEVAKPAGKPAKKVVVEEPEEDEEDDDEETAEGDAFDEMDRTELKQYIADNELEISVKKSMTDDDIRGLIRDAVGESESDEEEDEVEEVEKPKSKVSLADIKKKMAGKK